MNMKRKIISIALIFILMFSFCGSIFAHTEEELKQSIEENENEIEGIKQEKQSAIQEIQNITSTINKYEDEIRVLKRKIEKLESSISENNVKIQKLQKEYEEKEGAERKSKIGTGDRSEKIRTYNYPQNRVTDHRIGFTTMNLDRVMEGELGPIIDALVTEDQRRIMSGE